MRIDFSAIAELAQWNKMGPEAERLAQTLEDEKFPGAVIPAFQSDNNPVFYALAQNGPEWRRLQPMLFAFVGPTLTDFEGALTQLDESEPIESYLATIELYAVSVLRPATSVKATNMALRSLAALQRLLLLAPDLTVSQSGSTSILLARLQDAVNGGDFGVVWRTYNTLKNELRLDARNLLQLEFQIHAAAGDWKKIRKHPNFELACSMRPAPITAVVLLETMYWSHFQEKTEHSGSSLDENVMDACRSLLACVRQSASPLVARIKEHVLPSTNLSEEPVTGVTEHRVGHRSHAVFRGEQTDTSNPVDCVKAAFLAFANRTDDDEFSIEEALKSYQRLGKNEQRTLLVQPKFKAIWSEIQGSISTCLPPINWTEWLNCLNNPEFNSSESARTALGKWSLTGESLGPVYSRNLVRAIEDVPEGIAGERLDQSLPYLVEWIVADPQWPRASLCPVYLTLLTRIALTTRRGEKTIKSTALLLESALRCGLSVSEYRDVMDAIVLMTSEGFSKHTAYDMFEFAEIASDFPTKDEAALNNATTAVANAAHSRLDRLTEGQRLVFLHFSSQIGWTYESDEPVSVTGEDRIAGTLSNLSIGIYTLTESAGRKAREVLTSIAPGITIELNHDSTATSALGALVARADIFVVAWASAKHAATHFIKSKRGSKPLIYAAGRGASSLIRAIEEYAMQVRKQTS